VSPAPGCARRSTSAGSAERHEIGDHRPALRQRAGLVDDQHIDLLGQFERLSVADEDAGARALSGADHDRRRRGQAQRARTGDDHHGHGIHQGGGEIAAEPPPCREGGERDAGHDRNENRRDAVDQPLHRRLRALRLLDQTNDAGQQRMRPHPRRLAAQQAVAVHRRGEHPVARRLAERQAFSGQHGLIDAR
jgi:hypothetical protein